MLNSTTVNCLLFVLMAVPCKAYVNGEKINLQFDGIACDMKEEDLIKYLKEYVRRNDAQAK